MFFFCSTWMLFCFAFSTKGLFLSYIKYMDYVCNWSASNSMHFRPDGCLKFENIVEFIVILTLVIWIQMYLYYFMISLNKLSLQNNTRYAGILRPMIRMINDSSLIYTVLCDIYIICESSVVVRWLCGI